jgi:hypothetical protein
MMQAAELAQILAAIAIAVGAGFFGGQVRSMLRELKETCGDHESRIRQLEEHL